MPSAVKERLEETERQNSNSIHQLRIRNYALKISNNSLTAVNEAMRTELRFLRSKSRSYCSPITFARPNY